MVFYSQVLGSLRAAVFRRAYTYLPSEFKALRHGACPCLDDGPTYWSPSLARLDFRRLFENGESRYCTIWICATVRPSIRTVGLLVP